MKRFFLLLMLAACGSTTTTGNDAGNDDSGTNDATQSNDSSSNDSSSSDSSTTDVTSGGDGGLGAGDTCDPQNNQCQQGLLCCSEPIHGGDAMSGFFCEKPVNKSCPLLP